MEDQPESSRKKDPQEQCQVDQNSYLTNKPILLNRVAVGFYGASENGRNAALASKRRRINWSPLLRPWLGYYLLNRADHKERYETEITEEAHCNYQAMKISS